MVAIAPRQTLVVIATAFVGSEVFHLVGQGHRRNRCRHRCGISARHHHDRRGLNVKILFVVGSWLLDRFFSGRCRRIFCSLSVFGRSLRGHSVFGFSGVFSRIAMGGSIAASFADNLGISALSGKGSRGSHAERKRESHACNDDMARRFHRKSPSFCATLANKRAAPHKQNMAEAACATLRDVPRGTMRVVRLVCVCAVSSSLSNHTLSAPSSVSTDFFSQFRGFFTSGFPRSEAYTTCSAFSSIPCGNQGIPSLFKRLNLP